MLAGGASGLTLQRLMWGGAGLRYGLEGGCALVKAVRAALSFIRDELSLPRDGLKLIRDGLSLVREGLSFVWEGLSLVRDGLSLISIGGRFNQGWRPGAPNL